jgi:hypothetical protein
MQGYVSMLTISSCYVALGEHIKCFVHTACQVPKESQSETRGLL